MIDQLPEVLLWDQLFLNLLDSHSTACLLITNKTFLYYAYMKEEWWRRKLYTEGLYTNERPIPEYDHCPGVAFLRLAYKIKKRYLCFSCCQETQRYHEIYHIPICSSCRQFEPYKMITKTTAMKEYCLKAREVENIPFIQVPNPHYRSAAPMRLYLLRDVLVQKGDRDTVVIKAKRTASLIKRRTKKFQSKETRTQELTHALQQMGLPTRDDSELCAMYINSKINDLDYVVNEMAFMRYLYEYTDFADRLEEYVESLCDAVGFYYSGIWREASDHVKLKYVRPIQWPWLKSENV